MFILFGIYKLLTVTRSAAEGFRLGMIPEGSAIWMNGSLILIWNTLALQSCTTQWCCTPGVPQWSIHLINILDGVQEV